MSVASQFLNHNVDLEQNLTDMLGPTLNFRQNNNHEIDVSENQIADDSQFLGRSVPFN